jgi:hypothetical protein
MNLDEKKKRTTLQRSNGINKKDNQKQQWTFHGNKSDKIEPLNHTAVN